MAAPDAGRCSLTSEPLTAAGFAEFGEVIDASRPELAVSINQSFVERFGDLATIDTAEAGGRTMLSLYRARPCPLPFRLRLLERHRLGSQAFMPLGMQGYLVIVAVARELLPRVADLRVFRAAPGQGVNLARGVWHHPLAALDAGDFLVIERAAPDGAVDCEEVALPIPDTWVER